MLRGKRFLEIEESEKVFCPSSISAYLSNIGAVSKFSQLIIEVITGSLSKACTLFPHAIAQNSVMRISQFGRIKRKGQ